MAATRRVLVSPTRVENSIGRIVELPDGSVTTEIWNGTTWVADKTKIISVIKGRKAGLDTMTRFGIPPSDRTPGELF